MNEEYRSLDPEEDVELEDGLPESVAYVAPDGREMEASLDGDEYVVNEFGKTWNQTGEPRGQRTEVDLEEVNSEEELYSILDSAYENDVSGLFDDSDLDPL